MGDFGSSWSHPIFLIDINLLCNIFREIKNSNTMKKYTLRLLIISLIVCSNTVFGQVIKYEGKAKILEFNPPYEKLKVDMLDDENNFIQTMNIEAGTIITNKKGNPIEIENLVPGTEINLIGEKINHVSKIKTIKLENKWKGEFVKLDGLIEYYDSDNKIAVVDGEKVKLDNGVKIKGKKKSKYKKESFDDFSVITLGNFVEIEGVRQMDGLIIAKKAFVGENEFTQKDRELRGVLGDEFSSDNIKPVDIPSELKKYTKHLEHLDRGYAQFGDARFKLVDNLKVQAYINYVGNKIVPQWQKNIPYGADERIRFRFYVIENPTFNAFALPNGMIFVHSGLLKMIDNEAQLAAILGHEIAHATHEHARERYEKQARRQKTLKLIKVAVRGFELADFSVAELLYSDFAQGGIKGAIRIAKEVQSLPPQTRKALQGVALGAKGIASNLHGQDRENQSDRVGLFYMEQAGYDPREAAIVWKKFMETTADQTFMQKMEGHAEDWLKATDLYPYQNPLTSIGDVLLSKVVNNFMDNWYSSHPKAKIRFRNLNQLVATNYTKTDFENAVVNTEDFDEVRLLF